MNLSVVLDETTPRLSAEMLVRLRLESGTLTPGAHKEEKRGRTGIRPRFAEERTGGFPFLKTVLPFLEG